MDKIIQDLIIGMNKRFEQVPNMGTIEQAIHYDYTYMYGNIIKLLKEKGIDESEIKTCLMFLITKALNPLVETMASKQFSITLKELNHSLKDFKLTQKDITKFTTNNMQAYINCEEMIELLHYKEENPLKLFERFVSEFGIKVDVGNGYRRFKMKFTKQSYTEKIFRWYWFNTLTEFFRICEQYMMKQIYEEVTNIGSQLESYILPENYIFDLTFPKDITLKQLYERISDNQAIAINYPLSHIYLLTVYESIDAFSNEDIMIFLLENIKKTKQTKAYKYAVKNKFPAVSFSSEEIINKLNVHK